MSVACPFSSASPDHNRSWALSAAAQVFLRGFFTLHMVLRFILMRLYKWVRTSCKLALTFFFFFFSFACLIFAGLKNMPCHCRSESKLGLIPRAVSYIYQALLNKGVSLFSLYSVWLTGWRGLKFKCSRRLVYLSLLGNERKTVSCIKSLCLVSVLTCLPTV